ncbi:MAG: hypothetical protein KDA36_10300, partial [Planctomycetaceae bacterium]|nr:hypothetical protein [Planctomycetaceae bacterium]
NVGGVLFFTADDGLHGRELWRTDGTSVGTVMVEDLSLGSTSSTPSLLTPLGNQLLFIANDDVHGRELWITDNSPLPEHNNAPELNIAGNPILTPIPEDLRVSRNRGTLVRDILASMAPNGGITDIDPNAKQGMAIIGANQTSGIWQYSTNKKTWHDFGSTSTSSALLLASDSKTRIRFLPNPDFAGKPGFTFVAWDQTEGANGSYIPATIRGGTSSLSYQPENAFITVTQVNDSPSVSTASVVNFDAISKTISNQANIGLRVNQMYDRFIGAGGGFYDADGVTRGVALVGIDNQNGHWQYSLDAAATWIDIPIVKAKRAFLLNATSRIRFVPNSDFTGTSTISFAIWDTTSESNASFANVLSKSRTSPFSSTRITAAINVI